MQVGCTVKRIVERILCPECSGAGETYFRSRYRPGTIASNECDLCDGDGEIDFDVATLAHNILWGAALAYEHESAIQEDRAIARGEFQPMCACDHQADRWGREECPACWRLP